CSSDLMSSGKHRVCEYSNETLRRSVHFKSKSQKSTLRSRRIRKFRSNSNFASVRKYKVPAYDYEQYDELLASEKINAVYIAVPNSEHRKYTVAAARAGVHV